LLNLSANQPLRYNETLMVFQCKTNKRQIEFAL
jgi:hypothetical protein